MLKAAEVSFSRVVAFMKKYIYREERPSSRARDWLQFVGLFPSEDFREIAAAIQAEFGYDACESSAATKTKST